MLLSRSNTKGIAFISTLIFVSVLSLVGIAGIHSTLAQNNLAVGHQSRTTAFQVANSMLLKNRSELISDARLDELRGADGRLGTSDDVKITLNENHTFGTSVVTAESIGHRIVVESKADINGQAEMTVQEIFIPDAASSGVDAALSLYGNSVGMISGSVTIDGHDWDVPETFLCAGSGCDVSEEGSAASIIGIYEDDTMVGINVLALADIYGAPAIQEGGLAKDKAYWEAYVNLITPYAAHVYGGGNHVDITMGTREAPQITYINGNSSLQSNNIDGAGILIIDGDVTFNGTMHFEGLVIINNSSATATDVMVNGTADIYGAVVVLGDDIDFDAMGTLAIKYSSAAISNIGATPTGVSSVAWQSSASE